MLARVLAGLALSCVTTTNIAAAGDTLFNFEKTGSLIAPPAEIRGDQTQGAYFTSLVKMTEVKGFPFKYALYFSTDHTTGPGGIWLCVTNGPPSQAAGWKSYDQAVRDGDFAYLANKPTKNPIYVDTVKGTQTETPYVNIVKGKAFMTYHNFCVMGGQATALATSSDGVNFQRLFDDDRAIILRPKAPGAHTGYFKWGPNPFSGIDQAFIGYSLYFGRKSYFASALWASDDAITWKEVGLFQSAGAGRAMKDPDWLVIWHSINPGFYSPPSRR